MHNGMCASAAASTCGHGECGGRGRCLCKRTRRTPRKRVDVLDVLDVRASRGVKNGTWSGVSLSVAWDDLEKSRPTYCLFMFFSNGPMRLSALTLSNIKAASANACE